MAEDSADAGGVELAEAIEALRAALLAAWWDGQRGHVRFRVEPVELTMQVGVTQASKGSAGVRWHVLALGGERSREAVNTQTLKLRLAPVLFDEQGNILAEAEQLIADREAEPGTVRSNEPTHERE